MKPEFAIKSEKQGTGREEGFTVLVIDTKKAKYQRQKWEDLDWTFKRKFENLLVITRPKDKLLIFYDRYFNTWYKLPDHRNMWVGHK